MIAFIQLNRMWVHSSFGPPSDVFANTYTLQVCKHLRINIVIQLKHLDINVVIHFHAP